MSTEQNNGMKPAVPPKRSLLSRLRPRQPIPTPPHRLPHRSRTSLPLP